MLRPERCKVMVAARRSGKTVGIRAKTIARGLDAGPGDIGYMAPTLGQAKRLLWRPLMQDLRDPAAAPFIRGKPNQSELTLEFATGTRLYLYSAEAPERVRGDGFKHFSVDESDDPLFTDDIFDEAIWPALGDNRGSLDQLGTPKGRGRLFREFRKGQASSPPDIRDIEYASIQVTAVEAGILDLAEIERARRTRPRKAFNQEYLATFNAPEGIVYDEWSEEKHVVDIGAIPPREAFDHVVVGVDWGTAARGAMMVCGTDRVFVADPEMLAVANASSYAIDPLTNTPILDADVGDEKPRLWVLEEHSGAGIPYTEAGWWKTARAIMRQWRPTKWYCDPAGGTDEATAARAAGYLRQLQDVLRDEARKMGLPTPRVIPADNRVLQGVSAVQSLMHYDDVLGEPPRLRVHRICSHLISAMLGYRWASARGVESEFVDSVVKKNDHELDAIRYVAYTHFYRKRQGERATTGMDWQ